MVVVLAVGKVLGGVAPRLFIGLICLGFIVTRTNAGITEVRSSASPTRLTKVSPV